ncbi:hypothetical protein [Beijerinckia indica]|uniref:hypothetical protein n=1 Tax=Beijerinckia indica TaxID=533 RepID=UPI001930BB87|nr:hypothetical protein [Beijerinckia indica]
MKVNKTQWRAAKEEREVSKIRDEQTKLTATYLNSLAVTVFAVGGLAPIVATLNDLGARPHPFPLIVGGFCILASGAHTLCSESGSQRSIAMNGYQIAALLITPIGGLLLAAWAYWLTRHDREGHNHHPAE